MIFDNGIYRKIFDHLIIVVWVGWIIHNYYTNQFSWWFVLSPILIMFIVVILSIMPILWTKINIKLKNKIDMKGKPLGDRVLIKVETRQETKSSGGIILRETSDDVVTAKVIEVSDGFVGQNGEWIKLVVKPGDSILVSNNNTGTKIRLDGEKYNLIRESEILMVI